jgi:hypothetical protein
MLPDIEGSLDLFCDDKTSVLPSTTKGCHEIRTGDAPPIKKNPYSLIDEMRYQLDEMLAKGVITPCA